MAEVSQKGINLLKEFEGVKLVAYLDSANIPTIGFGTTVYPDGTKVKMGDKITKKEAEEYLYDHINKHVIPYIDKLVKVPLKQNEVDALVSLIYNIGATNFKNSTLLKKINSRQSKAAIELSWKAWNKAGGKTLRGLVNRRLAEINLYKQ